MRFAPTSQLLGPRGRLASGGSSCAKAFERLIADNILRIRAGGLLRIESAAHLANAVWRERGTENVRKTNIVRLINCTGPNGLLRRTDDPLISGLYQDGILRQDPLGLGVDVDLEARVIRSDGIANATLFAIGPIARGALWEVTSVPDIRSLAATTSDMVMQSLGFNEAYSAITA